jgi:hypothetical protein
MGAKHKSKHIQLTSHPDAGIEVGERIRLPVPDGKLPAPDELAKPEGRGRGE